MCLFFMKESDICYHGSTYPHEEKKAISLHYLMHSTRRKAAWPGAYQQEPEAQLPTLGSQPETSGQWLILPMPPLSPL